MERVQAGNGGLQKTDYRQIADKVLFDCEVLIKEIITGSTLNLHKEKEKKT
jgi:hypothetical protein